ncbi:MAG: large repetitive protein, partial [Chloroflexota bacterium]|nr:large repetitive protein [Chloroflexota bacterium]
GLTHHVGMQSQPDPTAPINLAAGQIYKDADFGYVKIPQAGKAVVGDLVWYDGDGDGARKPAEPGIPGVTVAITNAAGVRIAAGVTDAAGGYLIEVPAGSGYIAGPDWAASPILAGLRQTAPASAFLPPLAAGQQWLEARLGIGEASPAAALAAGAQGLQGGLLGAIGNLVFLDADRNGAFGAGDAALGGVTIALIRDSDGNRDWDQGEPIIATATTSSTLDATGANYLFTGVPAGNYLVHVSDTAGVLADYARGPLGAAGVDGASQSDPYAVALVAGAAHRAADFGFYRTAGLLAGVIGNQVWGETDGDGRFTPPTGDLGVAGVTVALLQDGDTVAATTTGADGAYAFVGRAAGAYQVAVSDDFGVLAGYAPTTVGPQPGQDLNNQAQPYTVTSTGASADLTADFGYRTGLGSAQTGATYAMSIRRADVDVRPGTPISFTIRITNTGTAWITYLPRQLAYSPSYLAYMGASPAAYDNLDDGLIRWHDLITAWGAGALAPGATGQLFATFNAIADTTRLLPDGRTTVTATAQGAWANPTGPALAGSFLLLAEQSGTSGARIILPTGLLVTGLAAARTPEGVMVTWQTANEARLAGFETLRRTTSSGNAGAWRVVSPALIAAEHAGANQGGEYLFLDRTAVAAERYEYALVAWLLDGGKIVFGPAALGR